jgi:uncharacterized SAM-binding protein YcdF (DUF218 family)
MGSVPRSSGRRLSSRLLLAAVAAWLASLAGVVLWGTRDAAAPSDVIVVLGAAQYAGRPSPVLRARLDHAAELWTRGLAKRVIVTGGRGAGDTTTKDAVGRTYLAAVAGIMQARSLKRAILVSDPFHMLRLQILSWRYRLEALPSPTRTSPISANRFQALVYTLGESLKAPFAAVLAINARSHS